jgi:hypothetical protein
MIGGISALGLTQIQNEKYILQTGFTFFPVPQGEGSKST